MKKYLISYNVNDEGDFYFMSAIMESENLTSVKKNFKKEFGKNHNIVSVIELEQSKKSD